MMIHNVHSVVVTFLLALFALTINKANAASVAPGRASSVIAPRRRPVAAHHALLGKQLSVRGGGGLGLDPSKVGKAFSVAYLLQGALFHFTPKQMAEVYGWYDPESPPSDQADYMTEVLGSMIAATGVASYSMFQGCTVNASVGYSCLSVILSHLRWILINGKHTRAGQAPSTNLVLLALTVLGAYAALTDQEWTATLVRIYATVFGLSALHTILFTETSGKAYGIKMEEDPDKQNKLVLLARGYGHFLLVVQLHNLFLVNGLAPEKAIAYASLSGLIHFIDVMLVRRHAFSIGKPLGYLFWLVYFGVSIPSILMEGSNKPTPSE